MHRRRLRVSLDAALLVSLVLLQGLRSTGVPAHEWIAVVFGLHVIVHLVSNCGWIAAALRRLMSPAAWRSCVNAALNATVIVTIIVTVTSGFAISEVVVPLAGYGSSDLRAWRVLHHLAARVALVVGLHLALNWDWIMRALRRRH